MKQARILVVEDNDDARTMFGIMLRSWGYEVIEASNGTEGLRAARHHKPDLILLDVMMPDMDGYTVCRELRAEPEFQVIPILFLTALDAVDDQIQAFTIGADDFLTKSKLDYNTLGVRIQAALDRIHRIQKAVPATHKQGTTVGLLSLRGGVGVSTLALNLANQAAQQHQSTLLIDLSFPVGSIGLWSGVSGPRHVVELLARQPSEITPALVKNFSIQNIHGFHFIPGPPTIVDTGRIRMQAVEKLLQVVEEEGYLTILDLGRGTLPLLWHVPAHCDWAVVVTSDDPTSRNLARLAMESLPEHGIDSRALILTLNDVTNARPKDINRDLPRSPDIIIPFAPNLASLPISSPVKPLWSLVSRLEK